MNTTEIAKLLLETRESLHKYACSLTWDWCKADDLVQDTILKILLNADKYEPAPGCSFYGWARRIMYRIFLNGLKHDEQQLSVSRLSFDADDDEPFVNKYFSSRAGDTTVNVSDIYRLIDTLPGDTGRVMRLLVEGHKYVEIAVRTELPIGTVKTHIRLSREILKRLLKDYLD